jgi:hypothetical protein
VSKKKQVIDLSGPDGNAFYLMAVVDKTFRQSGAPELGKQIVEEMKKGDYEHLLKTFELYLGDHFKLVR